MKPKIGIENMRSHAGDKKVEAQQHSKSLLDHHFTHHFTNRRFPPGQAESMAASFGKRAIEVNAVSEDESLPDLQVIGEGK
jgi:hypothetical protein